MNQTETEYSTLNILDIVALFWKYKFIIIGFMIAGALLMWCKTTWFTPDTYTASGVLYVSNKSTPLSNEVVNKSDIDSARSLSTTYMETLKTRSFLMDISADVGDKYSWQQIKRMLTVSAVNGTELLSVTVTAESDEDAYRIARSIIDKAPSKLTETFSGGEVTVVDRVIFPTAPNDKGLVKKVITGAAMGTLLGCALVFLIRFFDTKVHKSEDVAKRYNVSILGEVAQ